MSENLEEAKDRLRTLFVGKAGIHGLGLNRARRAIRVYVGPHAPSEQSAMVERLRESAKPFDVILVQEEPPSAK